MSDMTTFRELRGVTYTQLQRSPAGVASMTAAGPLRVHRRNHPDLVVMEASTYERPDVGLVQTVNGGEGTAETYAEGFTPQDPLEWLEDAPRIKRPE